MVKEHPINFVGNTYGIVRVTEDLGIINRNRYVLGVCHCGKLKKFRLCHLKSGKIVSCGCYNLIVIADRSTTHGLSYHPLYRIYCGIIQRCYDKNSPNYKRYGARGVAVCKEWLSDFTEFYHWAIDNGWRRGYHIDKDIKAPNAVGYLYSPDYCSVVTRLENSRHTRASKIIEYKGERKCLSEWCDDLCLNYGTIADRLRNGWGIAEAFESPTEYSTIEYNGIRLTISEWASKIGLNKQTLWARLSVLGWSVEKSLTTKNRQL